MSNGFGFWTLGACHSIVYLGEHSAMVASCQGQMIGVRISVTLISTSVQHLSSVYAPSMTKRADNALHSHTVLASWLPDRHQTTEAISLLPLGFSAASHSCLGHLVRRARSMNVSESKHPCKKSVRDDMRKLGPALSHTDGSVLCC